MNINALIAALGGRFDSGEAAEIERALRAYNGTIPDDQLISEASLALPIHRRGRRLICGVFVVVGRGGGGC
ncbi:MAG: hypothetical protein WCK99_12055 [Mycobacteriaceae bacterium]